MNPAEILARLNPQSIPIDPLPPGYGGLSIQDVAASLAGLNRPAQLILLSKYAMFAGQEDQILYYVLNFAAQIWAQNKWIYPKGQKDFIRRLSKLALIDVLFPLPCKRCRGHKRVMRREGYSVVCSRCEGFGTSNLSDRERARLLEMPYSSWREHRYHYKTIADHVACWHTDGLEHVRRRLSG